MMNAITRSNKIRIEKQTRDFDKEMCRTFSIATSDLAKHFNEYSSISGEIKQEQKDKVKGTIASDFTNYLESLGFNLEIKFTKDLDQPFYVESTEQITNYKIIELQDRVKQL